MHVQNVKFYVLFVKSTPCNRTYQRKAVKVNVIRYSLLRETSRYFELAAARSNSLFLGKIFVDLLRYVSTKICC